MKNKKPNRITLIIAAVVVIVMAASIVKNIIVGRSNGIKERTAPVKTIKVQTGEMEDIIYVNGKLTAINEANLVAKTAGRIAQIYVEEGQFVSKGQPLLKLENEEFAAQLSMAKSRFNQAKEGSGYQATTTGLQIKNAQANFSDAKTDYERMKNLFAKGAIARQQMEDARLHFDLAEAALSQAKAGKSQDIIQKENIASARAQEELAQAQFDNTFISAPFDGIITRKNCKVGQYVVSGGKDALFQIVDNSKIYFEGSISEMDIGKVEPGQKAKIEVFALNKIFSGIAASISEASDPSSRSVHVKIAIPAPSAKLISGLAAKAQITAKKYNGIIIPSYIIRKEADKHFVVVPEGDKAKFCEVKIGIKDENNAIITEGLKAGEVVISSGSEGLKEGDAIEVSL